MTRTPAQHKGSTREARGLLVREPSTPEEKGRRHRNKLRIWRRCTAKLRALTQIESEPLAA